MSSSAYNMNNPAKQISSSPNVNATVVPGAVELIAARWFDSVELVSPMMQTEYFALEAFVAGGLEIEIQGHQWPAGQWQRCGVGSGVLYAPGTIYRERLASGERSCRSLYAYINLSDQLVEALGISGRPYVWIDDPRRQLTDVLREVVADQMAGWAGVLRATGGMYQAMGILAGGGLRGDMIRIGAEGGVEMDLLARVHRYFQEHLGDAIKLEDVAHHLQISESGLSHAYRQLAGRSPMQTLRLFRLDAAMQDLRRRNGKLEIIARRYGFADAFHLSRTFKQQYGASPRHWLAQQRKAME